MNVKRIVLLFAIIFCVLPGCQHEVFVESDREVLISFSAQLLSSSLLKSAASTEENSVENLLLYGVDAQGNVIEDFLMENPSLNDTTLTLSKKVKSLYAIANPCADLIEANPENLSDLMSLTGDFANTPQLPFLMGGKGDVNDKNVHIALYRTVAKIEIFSKNEFQIMSVTVKESPNKGYVFKQETLSIPTSADLIAYPIVNVNSVNPVVLYVPENSKTNPTEFVVAGTYLDKPINYTIVLKSEGVDIDIVRNTHYEVGISAISDMECSITVNIPAWNDVVANNQVITIPKPLGPDYKKDGIKILTIGNSYTQNALLFVHLMLKQLGVTGNIKVVNAFLPGGYLKQHAANMKTGVHSANFRRQLFPDNCHVDWGTTLTTPEAVVKEDDWDVIVLQQADEEPPFFSTYDDIDYIIAYLAEHSRKKDYKLGWHMTWSYSNLQPGCDQSLYNQYIIEATQTWVVPILKTNGGPFDFIIPVGTAIQKARALLFGDHLNCDSPQWGQLPLPDKPDYLHLNNVGCYVAGAMWIKTITGYDIAELVVPYKPPETPSTKDNGVVVEISPTMLNDVVSAVNAAHAAPYTMY